MSSGNISEIKEIVNPIRSEWIKKLRAKFGLLPNFIIIGIQKGGTTSLYQYLSHHPYISASACKEIHYFSNHYNKGIDWYRSFFPTVFYKFFLQIFAGKSILTGEASPSYLFRPHAAKRIYELLPHCKLVILLRNPVDRALSQYVQHRKSGKVLESLESVILRAKKEYPEQFQKMQEDKTYKGESCLSLLKKGIYIEQIKEWQKYFPKEQMLILKSEDLFSEPNQVYQEVLDFLDIPPYELEHYRVFNKGKYEKFNVKISPELRKELVEFFQPHNETLYDFLGKDFAWE